MSAPTVLNAAPITASLVLGAVVVWMAIAVPVGVYSALRPRSVGDRVAMTGVLTGISVHPVWLGLIASYFLGYKLDLFPIQGYCAFHGRRARASRAAGRWTGSTT